MSFSLNIFNFIRAIITMSKNKKAPWQKPGAFLCEQRGNPKRKSDNMAGFSYKEQFAVVVICKDEKEQKNIYNRLKDEGFKLKVVAV